MPPFRGGQRYRMEQNFLNQETAGITPATQKEQESELARVLIFGGLDTAAAPFSAGDALALELSKQDMIFSALHQGDAAAAHWLMQAGVDLIAMAGMRSGSGDASAIGFIGTCTIGAGETEAMAYRPYIRSIDGIRVCVVSYAEQPAGGFNNRADILELMAYDRVRMLLNQCDHVFVLVQSGLDGAELPLPEWRARHRHFIDAGASLVVDTGAVKGWEVYKHGLVFYGLGSPAEADALGLFLTLQRNGKFTYESRALQNTAGNLDFSQNNAFRARIDAQNALLMDEKAYLSDVNDMCMRLYCAAEAAQKRGVLGLFSQHADEEQRLLHLMENESARLVALRALRLLQTDGKGKRENAKKA